MNYDYSGERLRLIWRGMRYRCNNPTNPAYKWYGARGIKICSDWFDFGKFVLWAYTNGYSDELTLDRIDNDGDYTPDNCRWATRKQQGSNKRNPYTVEPYDKSSYKKIDLLKENY